MSRSLRALPTGGTSPEGGSNQDAEEPEEDLGLSQSSGTWYALHRYENPAHVNNKKTKGVPEHFRATIRAWGGLLEEDWAKPAKKTIVATNPQQQAMPTPAREQTEEGNKLPPSKTRQVKRQASPSPGSAGASKRTRGSKKVDFQLNDQATPDADMLGTKQNKKRKGTKQPSSAKTPETKPRRSTFERMRAGSDEEPDNDGVLVDYSDPEDAYAPVELPEPPPRNATPTATPERNNSALEDNYLPASDDEEDEREQPGAVKQRRLDRELANANPATHTLLYDKNGKFTGAWSKVRRPDLYDLDVCGVEGFISDRSYVPPNAGMIEPVGLLNFRSSLVKRNETLLKGARCDAELVNEVIMRALEEDSLGWDAAIAMARTMVCTEGG